MNFNNFYPYGPNQYSDGYEDEIYSMYDERTFPGMGGFPGGGPGGYPGGGGGAPTSPPPAYIPQEAQIGAFAVDPGAIRRCLFRFTYVWLVNGRSFWFYPIFVGRTSVAGYRWSRRYGWRYFGIDLRQIRSFQC